MLVLLLQTDWHTFPELLLCISSRLTLGERHGLLHSPPPAVVWSVSCLLWELYTNAIPCKKEGSTSLNNLQIVALPMKNNAPIGTSHSNRDPAESHCSAGKRQRTEITWESCEEWNSPEDRAMSPANFGPIASPLLLQHEATEEPQKIRVFTCKHFLSLSPRSLTRVIESPIRRRLPSGPAPRALERRVISTNRGQGFGGGGVCVYRARRACARTAAAEIHWRQWSWAGARSVCQLYERETTREHPALTGWRTVGPERTPAVFYNDNNNICIFMSIQNSHNNDDE